jgi:hypothetical protein
MLTSINCKKNSNPTDNMNSNTTQIFPLSIGNQWIIQVTNYDTTGNVVYSKNDTIKILRDTIIQSEKWFIGYGIITNRDDGLYDYQVGSSNEIVLKYKYPSSTNSIYTYRGTQIRVLSIADSVSVQAGGFVCYRYREGVDTISYNDWYLSPNVGLVKADFYNPLSGGRVYKYLSYSLIKHVL